MEASEMWADHIEGLGTNGLDVACYVGDKVSVWPCSGMGEESEGQCECDICSRVRNLLKYSDDDGRSILDVHVPRRR